MRANIVEWEEIKENYTEEELPEGYAYTVICHGPFGTSVGYFYNDFAKGDNVFFIGITAPTGLIPAKLLGVQRVTIIQLFNTNDDDSTNPNG